MRVNRSVLVASAVLLALTSCSARVAPPAAKASASAPSSSPAKLATFGAIPTAPMSAANAAALQQVLDAQVTGDVPDVLATVITPRGIWSGAAGVDGPHGRRAQPNDVVALASISKTFTSALILRLAEQHRIDLDAKLSRYLDDAAAARSNGATVRQALGMRSGIPDTPDAVRDRFLGTPTRVVTAADIVSTIPAAATAPGGDPVYSNPTYKLLGYAAEGAGKGTFADLLQHEVIDPAHVPGVLVLQRAGVRTPGPWAVAADQATAGAGGALPSIADATLSASASAMAGDTRSTAIWGWHLFAGDIVSEASLEAMTVSADGDIGSGLDPYQPPLPAGTLGHDGTKDGYQSLLVVVPSDHAVVMVSTNRADTALDVVAAALLSALH